MLKIPSIDALLLVRDLGLLVNQVAIYGISHKAIQHQAVSFFHRLKPLALTHETVEFALQGEKLAVNGETDGIDPMSARNLKERMLLHKLPGIFFSPDLTQHEFLSFLSCLGKPPVKVQEMGGFSDVLKKCGVKGVSLVHFVYKRIDPANPEKDRQAAPQDVPLDGTATPGGRDTDEKARQPAPQDVTAGPPAPPPGKRPRRTPNPQDPAETSASPAPHAPPKAHLRRKQVQTELGALIAEVTRLFGEKDGEQSGKVLDTLRAIRDTLRTSTETSKERIAILLSHEELPADTAAPVKARPKKRAPRFSHAEYMRRFAELTQEIAQPLTVTNSVIEILRQGQIGPLTEAQTHFLDLALESVDRVNQLIKYMHTLYGEPESLTPNAALISETYQ